jgi:hypothetical protein
LPTPRYRIGMRGYECRFPRINLLGDLVDRGLGGALTISAGSIYDGL